MIFQYFACLFGAFLHCVSAQVSCTFENGPCGWQNVSNDPTLGWGIWDMGAVGHFPHDKTGFSGPTDDHTYKSLRGHYLFYTYVTRGRCSDITEKKIESDFLNLPTRSNFTFWYVLKGGGIGYLILLGKNDTKLWDSTVNHDGSKSWMRATLLLDPGFYRLTFKANCKFSTGSDIAIDDISLEGEPLSIAPTTQEETTLSSKTTSRTLTKETLTTANADRTTSTTSSYGDNITQSTTTADETQNPRSGKIPEGTTTTKEEQTPVEASPWIGAVAGGAGGLTAAGLGVAGIVLVKMKCAGKAAAVAPAAAAP